MAAIQAIDATTLRALLAELRSALLPSRFEKAQQADPHTLQLALRSLEGVRWIEISWLAEAPGCMPSALRRARGREAPWPCSCNTACGGWPWWP